LSIFGSSIGCGVEKGEMARIDQVAGIGHREATKLRKVGIRTSKSLVELASTRRGRTELAKKTGLSPKDLQMWVHHADLLRVRGVGAEYAALLVEAGVDTLRDLRRRNPTALLAKIIGLNGSQKVVERLPTEAMVLSWIAAATEIDPSINA
jgi:nucleotidyltransferase/DNA polymerase involved in DNA repair